jgi:hypothetical protein
MGGVVTTRLCARWQGHAAWPERMCSGSAPRQLLNPVHTTSAQRGPPCSHDRLQREGRTRTQYPQAGDQLQVCWPNRNAQHTRQHEEPRAKHLVFTLSLYTLGKARPMRVKREVKVIVRECVG